MMKVAILLCILPAVYAAECPNIVGEEAVPEANDGCDCGTANTCTQGKFCVKDSNKCVVAKVCASIDGTTEVADEEGKRDCGCGVADTAICAAGKFCYLAHDVCLAAAIANCASVDGTAATDKSCQCGTAFCKATETCTSAENKCAAAAAAEAAACANKDGSTAVADAQCKCKDDTCDVGKFCDESAEATKQCLDAKKEAAAAAADTTTATTKAGTTKKAASMADAVAAAEAAAVALRTGALNKVKAMTAEAVKAKAKDISVTGVAIDMTDVTYDVAKVADGELSFGKLNCDKDLTTDKDTLKKVGDALITAILDAASSEMFSYTATKSARILEAARALAAANYDVKTSLKSEADVKADAKKKAETAWSAANTATVGSGAAATTGAVAMFAAVFLMT